LTCTHPRAIAHSRARPGRRGWTHEETTRVRGALGATGGTRAVLVGNIVTLDTLGVAQSVRVRAFCGEGERKNSVRLRSGGAGKAGARGMVRRGVQMRGKGGGQRTWCAIRAFGVLPTLVGIGSLRKRKNDEYDPHHGPRTLLQCAR